MSRAATLNRQAIQRFNSYWEDLMEEFPEARAEAVRTMGQAARRELNDQIRRADLEDEAKGTVISWQNLRFGSKGGYAALSALKASSYRPGAKPKSWNGTAVTVKQVTKWLERGHGVRKPAPGSARAWVRVGRSGLNKYTGLRYVKGRMFYSWTKMKVQDHALDAATEAMKTFAKEIIKMKLERYS